ncbi:MAG TPA: hypothetical protein PLN40_02420, partial [Agitococcus sp.]|nr:hypothetical protein [Agitococcus sp.]HNA20256.1 hypothetical protein [Agitococcus sp.]
LRTWGSGVRISPGAPPKLKQFKFDAKNNWHSSQNKISNKQSKHQHHLFSNKLVYSNHKK